MAKVGLNRQVTGGAPYTVDAGKMLIFSAQYLGGGPVGALHVVRVNGVHIASLFHDNSQYGASGCYQVDGLVANPGDVISVAAGSGQGNDVRQFGISGTLYDV